MVGRENTSTPFLPWPPPPSRSLSRPLSTSLFSVDWMKGALKGAFLQLKKHYKCKEQRTKKKEAPPHSQEKERKRSFPSIPWSKKDERQHQVKAKQSKTYRQTRTPPPLAHVRCKKTRTQLTLHSEKSKIWKNKSFPCKLSPRLSPTLSPSHLVSQHPSQKLGRNTQQRQRPHTPSPF